MKTRTPLHRIAALFALALLATFGATHDASAQTASNLVTWAVNGMNGQSTAATNLSATGVQATAISLGSGLTVNTLTNAISATGINTTSASAALATNDFFEFTVSAAANYSLSFSNLNTFVRRSGTGATNAGWYWSRDGYATALVSTNNVNETTGGGALNASLSTNGITTSTTFRLVGWNAGNTNTGTWQIRATNTARNPTLLGTATLRSASTLTWDGGRGNGSWTAYDATNANQANWNGNNTPLNGDSLLFAGTTQTNTTNDVSSLLANAIVFSNTAGTYAISGNALTVSNGITNLSANAQTFSNVVTLGAAQTFNASAGNLTFAGNIANGGNLLTVDGSGNSTFSQQISGGGGLTKNGAGSLILSGTSTYNGATTLNAGTTRISGSISSSAVAVNNTAVLEGAGTTGGLTINSGGRVAPGNGAVGNLSVSSLTLESGGGYNWEIGGVTGTAGTNWDLISSTGATTVNSTSGSQFTIYMLGTWAGSGFLNSGTYNWTIIDGTSSSGFSADKFALDLTGFTGGTATGTFSFTESSGDILLNYTAPVSSSLYTWNAGSGAWSVGANWTNGTAPTSTGASLQFTGGAGTATNDSGTVTSVTGVLFTNTTGSITLDGSEFAFGAEGIKNASTDAHTISNNLTLSAASIIEATSGSLTIAGNVTNDVAAQALTLGGANNTTVSGVISGQGNVVKSGAGTATLDGNNTFTGSLSANAGSTIVNGTLDTLTINVGGGTLMLGASDRLANSAAVSMSGGTLDFGGFTDTVSSYAQTGGTFSGNGTLTASTYALNGGTVSGNLGAGTATASSGSTTLNGTLAALTVNVSGGSLTLGANDRLDNAAALSISSGTFSTGAFNDTVGSFSITGGTHAGSGTLTASTYALNGGTVSGNLGAGTATASSGSTTLSGTLAAATVNVSGGSLTLGANDRISGSSAVTVSSGTLNFGGFTDSVGSFTLNGGVFTNGTLTSSTYTLAGGTVGGTLGAGTANVSGTVTLSGLINSTLNVNSGGTLTLAAADRIDNASAVTVDAGTLATATFSDTVGSLLLTNNGSLTGSGTITAGTYTLNGGTVSANLGAGTANVSAGTTTLNGSLGASTVNIDGGTLALGGNGRIDNAAVVILSSGALDMGTFIDGVGTFNMTGGTVNGSIGNSLSAINGLNLQAGTINANIGNSSVSISNGTTTINGTVGGAVAVSSGTANLNGALNSSLTASGGTVNLNTNIVGNVTVSGGSVNLAAADLIGNTSAVNVSSGSLNMNGNESVGTVQVTGGTIAGTGLLNATNYDVQAGTIAAQLSGSGAMNKTGVGTTTLSGDNSGYTGAVTVRSGSLLAGSDTALGSGPVTMTNGSILATAGRTIANGITIGSPAGFTSNNFTAYWNFGTTNGNANATTTTGTGITFGAVSQGNNNGTTTLLTSTTTSSGYTDASGQFNAGAAARTGALNTGASGSAYFEFTLTADSGVQLSLTNLTFGSRGTGTGPTLATLLSSINNYSTNTAALATNALGANSTWALISPTVAASTLTNGSVTFRIYGSAGTGSPGVNTANWRIDDLNLFGYTYFDAPVSGSGTLGINEAGSATFTGAITNNNVATLTAASGGTATFSGGISGLGSVTKTGAGDVVLAGANIYSGGTTINEGVLYVGNGGTSGSITGPITNNSSLVFNRSDSSSYSGAISGSGTVTKSGAGSLTLSGASTYTNATTVSAGTLELNNTTGQALGSTASISVASGATLLISQSNQINDSAAITLSGGTITRGSGVSEVFASLNLMTASTLDFGLGATGSLNFGTYEENTTPSALLTINNFIPGNSFTFSNSLFAADGSNLASYFDFQSGYINSSITNNGSGSFTITAIPEPSTYLAAAGLLSLMLWPSRKRLLKDAKKILGLRAPMRDRLASRRA